MIGKNQLEFKDIHRSEIKMATYNPRKISDAARKKLKKNLKKNGLLESLLWNKRTGNLISGHQRLSILDEITPLLNYFVHVCVVDMTEEEEVKQNIFMNSTSSQGEYDLQQLSELIENFNITDYDDIGFTIEDINIIGVNHIVQEDIQKEQSSINSDIEMMRQEYDLDREHKKQQVKDMKNNILNKAADKFDEGERYVTITFESYSEKSDFMRKLGLAEGDLYILYKLLRAKIELV